MGAKLMVTVVRDSGDTENYLIGKLSSLLSARQVARKLQELKLPTPRKGTLKRTLRLPKVGRRRFEPR